MAITPPEKTPKHTDSEQADLKWLKMDSSRSRRTLTFTKRMSYPTPNKMRALMQRDLCNHNNSFYSNNKQLLYNNSNSISNKCFQSTNKKYKVWSWTIPHKRKWSNSFKIMVLPISSANNSKDKVFKCKKPIKYSSHKYPPKIRLNYHQALMVLQSLEITPIPMHNTLKNNLPLLNNNPHI